MSRFAMHVRARSGGSRFTASAATAAVVFSLVSGVVFANARHGAPALADASTGTGGVFVATQGRVLDTRAGYGTGGYTTPMSPNVWRTVDIAGNVGIPAAGASAVQVTITALAPLSQGTASVSADLATPKPEQALVYGYGTGADSNTAVVALASDGNIKVEATTGINMVIDVQGYYTNGDTADGGYVPVSPTRILDTRNSSGLPQVAGGSTTSISVAGKAGVPADATAVFVNFTVLDFDTTAGYLTPYAADSTKPTTSLNFPYGASTALGTTVPLSSAGGMKVYLNHGPAAVDLVVDVVGYFSGTSTVGAFTPAVARVANNAAVAANTVATVQVAGVAGVPLAGSGISAVALNVAVAHTGSAGGYIRVWSTSQAEPATSSMDLIHAPSTVSNFVTTQVGDDGKVNIRNASSDPVTVTVSVQGWYTNLGSAIPAGQDRTQQRLTLQGTATGGGDWVTYKYRVGAVPGTAFAKVPTGDVTVPGTSTHPSAWPVQRNGSHIFDPYTWDLGGTLGSTADALVQVEACFGTSSTDANPACTMPSNVTFSQASFGDSFATDQVGPGTVSLLTGDYEISATDVTVASYQGSLSIGRAATTLHPAAANTTASGVFGPGWTADLSGPDAGAGDLTVNDQTSSGYVIFTDVDGSPSVYQATSSLSTYPISFVGVGDAAADGSTVTKVSASKITMADQDGTVTTWTKPSSGAWQATSVQEASSNSTTTYTYNSAGLVTQILAPVPAGVTCTSPSTTPGCRSLTLAYTTVAGATRLASVSLVAYAPTTGAMVSTGMEDYSYDSSGRLAAAWDHRISPTLKTIYTYNSNNALATVTPPGLAAWSFGYDSTGRLSTVSRPDAANLATATSTVVYGGGSSSITGSNAPVEMGASATGTWDQTGDLPATATAVFDPNRVPAGTTWSTVGAADWPYATLHYLDVNGREVNTAQYGAGGAWQITTAQFDANGNDVWDLTPRNRAQALSPTSFTDPAAAAPANSYDRADLLASTTVFDPLNPSDDTDDYGPIHPVTLTSGTVVDAEDHTNTTYDEGSPGGTFDGLPTTIVTSAYTLDGADHDPVTTHKGYGALVSGDPTGWSLDQATTSTVQMGSSPSSADLVTATRYNNAGQVTETRLPGAGTDGSNNATDARTTATRYYTAGTSGTCVSNAFAGLPCSVGPAVQPTSGNPLAVKTFTYNRYNQPLTTVETAGTTTRTTTVAYDTGDRLTTKAIAVSPASDGGAALPAVTYGYDATTGLPTTTSTGSGASTTTLTTGYDNLGRVTSYTDANGTTSTTSYDIDGRPVSRFDGQLTTTYTYDTSTEHRGMVTSEDIGVAGAPSTFTADYDANGTLATETYPSGLTATTSHDNSDNPTALNYAKSGSTWMTFTASYDAEDRIVAQSSPQSSQNFTFDPADRLTTVQDTYSSACTTRTYSFDRDSNRTSLKSYPGDGSGHCTTGTTPTSNTSTFDQADRSTDTGYTYDTLGRATSVPSVDAQGVGSNAGTTGTLTLGYDSNDMVATQSQGSAALTFNLDPLQNRVISTSDGMSTITNHYAGATDNPSWTATGTTWTDNITGPEGSLGVTCDQAGTVILQLTNLHGDTVATAADDPTATTASSYSESTEYGAPRNSATAPINYGWLGAKQRSSNSLGGLVVMGVRLYNPATGTFLSPDPILNGNANPYTYPTDPIDALDLNGQFSVYWHRSHVNIYLNNSEAMEVWQDAQWGIWPLLGGALGGEVGAAVGGVFAAWMDRHPPKLLKNKHVHIKIVVHWFPFTYYSISAYTQ